LGAGIGAGRHRKPSDLGPCSHPCRPCKLWLFATCIAVLSLFSSLPLFVGFIMADFFTPILVLVIYLIGFHFSTLSSLEKAYFILLAAVAVMAHVSHFSLGLALIRDDADRLAMPATPECHRDSW
jgi:hypothetical protein